jgi:hypothetical protein
MTKLFLVMDFIKKIIKGEIELAVTFWLTIVIQIVLNFFEKVLKRSGEYNYATGEYSNFYIFVDLIAVIILGCLYLGTWRSAGIYIIDKNEKKESSIWGYLAKTVTLVFALFICLSFLKGFIGAL